MKHTKLLWPLLGVTASVAAVFGIRHLQRIRRIARQLPKGVYPDFDRWIRLETIKTQIQLDELKKQTPSSLPKEDEEKTETYGDRQLETWSEDAATGAAEPVPGIDLPSMEVISEEEYNKENIFEKLPLYFYRWDNVLCDDAGIPIAPQYWELYIPGGLIEDLKAKLKTDPGAAEGGTYIRNYDLCIDFELVVVNESYVNTQADSGYSEELDSDLDELTEIEGGLDDD